MCYFIVIVTKFDNLTVKFKSVYGNSSQANDANSAIQSRSLGSETQFSDIGEHGPSFRMSQIYSGMTVDKRTSRVN